MVSDEAARSTATEILASGEFTRWTTEYASWLRFLERLADLIPDWLIRLVSWIERSLGRIFDWIADFLGLFGISGDVSEGVGWLAVCTLAAAVIVLGWHWQSRRGFAQRARATPRNPGRIHADALREAVALAHRGRFLEAAHRVQLATLAMLIEFDWLELARSDPNRTLRDRVRESALPARERRRLIELVDRLERLWFDERREDRGLFEDWLSLDERLVSIATGGTA